MKILGIDPGLAKIGFAVLTDPRIEKEKIVYGEIKTKPADPLPLRLQQIHNGIRKIIEENNPDVVAIESMFFAANVKTAIQVFQAKGVIILATADFKIKLVEYTPNQIKQAVTGNGAAKKFQVQQFVKTILNLPEIPTSNHAADALAIAICHTMRLDKTSNLF